LQLELFPAKDALLALTLTAASRFEPAVKKPKTDKMYAGFGFHSCGCVDVMLSAVSCIEVSGFLFFFKLSHTS